MNDEEKKMTKKNNGRRDDDGPGRSGWLARLKFPSRTGDVPL